MSIIDQIRNNDPSITGIDLSNTTTITSIFMKELIDILKTNSHVKTIIIPLYGGEEGAIRMLCNFVNSDDPPRINVIFGKGRAMAFSSTPNGGFVQI